MKPLLHQQRIIDLNPTKAILNWEMRVGKSLPAAIWIDLPEQEGNTYIITLKKNKKSWQEMGTKAHILTKSSSKCLVCFFGTLSSPIFHHLNINFQDNFHL